MVSGVDVGVLERLENPTTGEAWHEPREIENMGLAAPKGSHDLARYFEVGTHGDARIVAQVYPHYDYTFAENGVEALFEVDSNGARQIACPSTRATDPCVPFVPSWEERGRSIDLSTHYDSLTFPLTTTPTPGWRLSTSAGPTSYVYEMDLFGYGVAWPAIAVDDATRAERGLMHVTTLVQLGDSRLVEARTPGNIEGTVRSVLGIETPFSSFIPIAPLADHERWYGEGAVTWDDGQETFTHSNIDSGGDFTTEIAPAEAVCAANEDTLAANFDPTEWQVAGHHRQGPPVYVPVDGGNSLAKSAWTWMRAHSWDDHIGSDLPYPYDSYAEFLAARSLFAWERPDGEWVIAVDGFAAPTVNECE